MLSQFRFGVQQPGEVGEFEMVRLWDFRRAVAAERLEDKGPHESIRRSVETCLVEVATLASVSDVARTNTV